MHFSLLSVIVLSALASLTSAFPGNSGVCDVNGADAIIAAVPGMQPASTVATPYTFTVTPATYTPGEMLTVTMNGAMPFKGFLAYATGTNPMNRVGTWTAPAGFQNNNNVCTQKGFISDNPASSLTHTTGQTYPAMSTFQFMAPATNVGPLSFNFIVIQAGAGYARGVYPAAAMVQPAAGGAAAPPSMATYATTSMPGYGMPPQMTSSMNNVVTVSNPLCPKQMTTTSTALQSTCTTIIKTNFVTPSPVIQTVSTMVVSVSSITRTSTQMVQVSQNIVRKCSMRSVLTMPTMPVITSSKAQVSTPIMMTTPTSKPMTTSMSMSISTPCCGKPPVTSTMTVSPVISMSTPCCGKPPVTTTVVTPCCGQSPITTTLQPTSTSSAALNPYNVPPPVAQNPYNIPAPVTGAYGAPPS